jgi:hypothetical protein
MHRLKVGYVPAEADPEEQERFKKRTNWSPGWTRRTPAVARCCSLTSDLRSDDQW